MGLDLPFSDCLDSHILQSLGVFDLLVYSPLFLNLLIPLEIPSPLKKGSSKLRIPGVTLSTSPTMVALAPVADIVPTLFPPTPTKNGIVHSDEIRSSDPIPFATDSTDVGPFSERGAADPFPVTANGNLSTQHKQNGLNSNIATIVHSDTTSANHTMAVDILKIIETYGVDYEKSGGSWKGLESFVPTVLERVERQEPIRMILPAFPFKSPNARDKVLGILPDFGEELALAHLNGLCQNIAQVYEPGADVYISSDGLVYNG